MKNNTVEALIGVVVLVAAGFFFWMTYTSTEAGTVSGTELSARFDRIDGLSVGSDVRISGIKVGTVLTQSLDPTSFEAVVTFSVRPDVTLPIDTSAEIASEGLLGGSYLSLSPGGMDEYLLDGDEIEFTQGALDLFGLIEQAVFSSDEGDDGN